MAPNYGAAGTGGTGFGTVANIVTTPGATTAASGSAYFAICSQYYLASGYGASSVISDNKGNAYSWLSPQYQYVDYPGAYTRASICWSGTGGSNHIWTAAMDSGNEGTLFALEMTGVTRLQDHQTANRASSTTITSPTGTASQAALAVAVIWGYNSDTAISVNNGYTIVGHFPADATSIQGAVAVLPLPAGGTTSVTWTITPAQEAEVEIFIFEGDQTSIVTGNESPAAPTETGANPTQNMNYVAMVEGPAEPLQHAEAIEVAIPTWVATGTFGDGTTGSTQFPLPAGIVKGDILEALCESANQTVTVSATGGGVWTQAANSPQGTGTAGGTSATALTRFWSRYDGVQTAPSFQCSGGNHVNGCIAAFRGCVPVGDPHHVNTGGVKATSSTTTSIPGSTTTKPNCLVVAAVSRMDDSNAAHYSGWTNANLSNITEIADGGGTGGNGGGIGACCGGLAVAGTYGATTATNATTTTNAYMTFALLGVEAGTASVTHAEQSPAAATQTATLSNNDTASVTGVQGPDASTETETLTQPNSVTGTQGPAAATETGTSLQTNTVTTAEGPAAPTETETLSQSSTVTSSQGPAQPTESTTLLQPSVVTPAESPAAPTETATVNQQWVVAQQSPAAPTETGAPFQGSQVTGIEGPAAQSETATLSQYFVAGTQAPATALETETVLQSSVVTPQESPAQPTETGTSLQTSSVVAAQAPAAANETGRATQAAVVAGSETTTAPSQIETLVQSAGVVGTEAPAQPTQAEALSQPSRVVGTEAPTQPTQTGTSLQTSSVVASEVTAQPVETVTLQQGFLVDALQAPDEPEQFGTLLQQSYVTGYQSPWQPLEVVTLQATSRVNATQGPPQPVEVVSISTYTINLVFAQEATSPALQWCTVSTIADRTGYVVTRRANTSPAMAYRHKVHT